jgi:hypothetical protein
MNMTDTAKIYGVDEFHRSGAFDAPLPMEFMDLLVKQLIPIADSLSRAIDN